MGSAAGVAAIMVDGVIEGVAGGGAGVAAGGDAPLGALGVDGAGAAALAIPRCLPKRSCVFPLEISLNAASAAALIAASISFRSAESSRAIFPRWRLCSRTAALSSTRDPKASSVSSTAAAPSAADAAAPADGLGDSDAFGGGAGSTASSFEPVHGKSKDGGVGLRFGGAGGAAGAEVDGFVDGPATESLSDESDSVGGGGGGGGTVTGADGAVAATVRPLPGADRSRSARASASSIAFDMRSS